MSSNSGSKTKENQESWESLFRKTLSKERLFTFTRPSENPIHWIHFLDPFDQQEAHKVSRSAITRGDLVDSERTPRSGHVSGEKLSQLKLSEAVVALAQAAAKASGESLGGGSMDVPSWPLIPFSKVQMIKCEKCGLEFCSPMNYRRHLRIVHRRQIYAEKEDLKSQRQQLATFWDSLSPEEAYKIVAVESLGVEDLTGEMVVRAVTQSLQQPSFFTLPHAYVKSGSVLLELVKRRSSRLLLTSSELFKVLDGSSEKTFPSFGLNTLQRYIFEAGAGKVGLETKNLVSSLGFLVELNLVKAFIKDKDEEAWRCQTALVEEEEASQRKRAETQARKRMKKVRRQDSKDKEQKLSDLAMVSDSDMSDDGISSSSESAIGYGLQSRPSSNTFENLYDRLAGEGSDSDQHPEVVSTAVSSPCENDQMQGNPDDTVSIGDEVVIACEAFGDGNFADASGFEKSCTYQKRKYPADRSLSFRGKALLLPCQKVSSNERDGLSAKKFPKQIMASYLKEDMGSASPCCPRVAVGGASVDKVGGFRPRQYVAKPVRIRNYQTTSQTGAAVWAKKVTKCADAASDKVPPCADRADCTSPEIAGPVQADGSAGISAFANLDGRNACSLSSGTTVCPSTESLSLSRGESDSNNQVNVAASKVAYCDHKSCPSTLSLVELGHYNNPFDGHDPASFASVVIGSVSVSLVDSMAGQEESALTLSSCMDEAVARKVVEAPEKNLAEVLCPAARTTQSFGALHENGVINCVMLKELERNGKSFKLPSDPEGKENSKNLISEAAKGSFTRPIAMQGGNFKSPRLKVWRPVVSNASPGNRVENVSASGSNSPDSDRVENVSASGHNTTMVSSNHVGREANLNNFNSRELELGQTEEDRHLVNFGHDATPVEENRSIVAGDGSAIPSSNSKSGWSSTLEAVSCFLSQRWSNAINSSDSVIVSVEDEEGCVRSSCENIGDVQIEDANVYAKVSGKPRPQSNKDAYYLSGNARRIGGVWKQGCSGSAMAANRRLMGKDNLHFSPKFSGYRYVPK